MSDTTSGFGVVIKQIRIYQWVKNLLLFVPMLLAHKASDMHALMQCAMGFIAFSALASCVYVLNDIADVEHDRVHPRKRYRPIASGAISIVQAWIIVAVLLCVVGFVAAAMNNLPFLLWLAVYAAVTSLYSFVLKRIVLVDVIALAGLYSLRLAAGGAAAYAHVSPWLLGFSLFLFISLAFLKRYTELRDTIDRDGHTVSGRGYHTGDTEFIMSAGPALGFVAVLIFTLYVNGSQVQTLYSHPDRMWLIAPCLVYWLSHLWLTAHRGGMHDDPIVFAARDYPSWIVGATITAIALAAT